MSLFAQFSTNSELENAGIVIKYGNNKDGSTPSFVISRMGKSNKRYAKALEKAVRPYSKQMSLGTIDDTLAEDLFMGVFIDTILMGWSNVQFEEGVNVPFNKENAKKLFKALPEMYDDLQEKSKSASLFRDEQLEDEAKN